MADPGFRADQPEGLTVRDVQILFVIAGYSSNMDRVASRLNTRHATDNWHFIAKDYPVRADKRANYLHDLTKGVVEFIFGANGAANFCREAERPCAVDLAGARQKPKLCRRAGDVVACARGRPRMIVAVVEPNLRAEFFERFSRSLLIYSDAELTADEDTLSDYLVAKRKEILAIRHFLSNLPRGMDAPNLPYRNYQIPTGYSIAADVADDPAALVDTLNGYHRALYDGSLQNPRRQLRGGYRFPSDVVFQKDRLHDSAQLGEKSRKNAFHLINAYHTYGRAVEPGMHFDVFKLGGGQIGAAFDDILGGNQTGAAAHHVNVTPCDRAWE